MLKRYIDLTLHPERYHGQGKQPPFFEGWYYKLVDAAENHCYAVIPGIFIAEDNSHAFVQVLDGMTGKATYHPYPGDAFQALSDRFEVRIGPNHFSAESITLDIHDDERTLRGEIGFSDITPWPVTLIAPGIMGWYGWLPFMECYHGVVSLDHGLYGSLNVNGATVDFSGGRGYIEKDWGQAFPSAYIWMQSNHFDSPGTCLTASVAMIPWHGQAFRGQILGLWHDHRLYRFASYTNAVTEKLAVSDAHVEWVVRDDLFRLEIQATRAEGGLLHAPIRTEMHRRVNETLKSSIMVKLSTVNAGLTVFEGTGRSAGLEVYGDLDTLLSAQ